MNQFYHLRLVVCRAVGEAHSHTAEPDCRNFQIAISQFSFMHDCSPQNKYTVRDHGDAETKPIFLTQSSQRNAKIINSNKNNKGRFNVLQKRLKPRKVSPLKRAELA